MNLYLQITDGLFLFSKRLTEPARRKGKDSWHDVD